MCGDKKLDRARDLFNELGSKGLEPNVITFDIVIGALCEEGNTEEALDLAMQMENNGCSPGNGTYNILVWGHVKRNKIEDAITLIDEMERRELILDPKTFEMLIEPMQEEGRDGILFGKVKKLFPKNLFD